MHGDEASAAIIHEPTVLLKAPYDTLVAMTIGDTVSRDDPDADLFAGIGDDGERAFDGVGGLVVIDDRRGAGFESFERPEFRRPLEHLEIERGIEAPPDLVENPL